LQPVSEDKVSLRVSEQADMLRLLKATLRSDPGRIIIGEVRDGAALTLLKGWNTGHPGGIATVHANSAEAGLLRMEQLIAEATAAPMQSLIAEAVNCLVFMDKAKGLPHVKDVLDVVGWDGHAYLTRPIE
jgi:type IV secretion system protein VirB11